MWEMGAEQVKQMVNKIGARIESAGRRGASMTRETHLALGREASWKK